MGNLYEQYVEMTKEAATVTETQPVAELTKQQLEVLAKYAEIAEQLMQKEGIKDYTEDHVIKVASVLIDHDFEIEQQQEKIAEAYDLGRIMYHGFVDEAAAPTSVK